MEKLIEKASKLDINISENQNELFNKYYQNVVLRNQTCNLTSILEENEFVDKHIIDSIAGQKFIGKNAKVCDIGAGAGFPSIPLKIVRQDLDFTLIDSLNKRVVFLNDTVSLLGLSSIKAYHLRAEEAAKKDFRESFDVVVARAVASLNTLIEYAVPLLKVGGIFVAYKGNADEEIANAKNALSKLHAKIIEIDKFTLPETDYNRTLVVIKKEAKTDKLYPRDKNKPKLSPL